MRNAGQPVSLEPGAVSDELRSIAQRVDAANASGDAAGLVAGARALIRAGRLRTAVDACHDALSIAPADPDVHRALAVIYRRRGWEDAARVKLRIVERYQQVVDDPDELDRLAATAEAARDLDGLLRVIDRHAERGRLAAALDLAFGALGTAPDDPRLHLAIASLHLARGRRQHAVENVARLARLVEISGDGPGRLAVVDFVNAWLRPHTGPAASGR